MTDPIQIRDFPEQPIAVIRDRAKQGELSRKIPDYCGKAWIFIQSRKDITSNGRMIATYRGQGADDMRIEVGAMVDGPFTSDGPVVSSSIPACRAAMMTHVGPYCDLGKAFDMLFRWCKQNNHATGMCWEVYHHPEPSPAAAPKTDIYVEINN